jgi:hypothetical protein
VKGVTGGTLETVCDLGDSDARGVADQDVHVVGRSADSEHLAVDAPGLALEQGRKPGVEARFEPRCAPPRRPDHVDQEEGGGVGLPGEQEVERIHRPSIDTTTVAVVRKMEIVRAVCGLSAA